MTRSLTLALGLACSLSACAAPGRYVWIDDYAPPPADAAAYVLQPGDVVQVRVFNQEGMSARVRIRSDGRVSLPFLGEVAAAGRAPLALGQRVEAGLKEFVKGPIVTVALEEAQPAHVGVLGEVVHPGLYALGGGRLVELLAGAGGLTGYAHRDRIFVLREGAPEGRIRLTYDAIARAEGRAGAFRLRPGDTVVVE